MDRHEEALIARVTDIGPILDKLKQRRLISEEGYDAVRALKTTQNQMREILKRVIAAGERSKDAFYEILKEKESFLVSDLEGLH